MVRQNEGKRMPMTGPIALDIAQDALWTLTLLSTPLLLVALIVGVGVGLFQALTQIQELTLTFVPKMLAMLVVFLLTLPLMGSMLAGLMARLAERIIAG
jgi:flagellar biosynthesis protein FliQ